MDLHLLDIVWLALLGLLAGTLGGLLGIGGSIIAIPGLVLLFAARWPDSQHLFQAAAMIVNVFVAIPAAIRHRRAGAFRKDLFRIMLPATAVAIVLGALLSNQIPSDTLQILFGVFLLYVVFNMLRKAFSKRVDHAAGEARVTIPRGVTVGGAMGIMAGLLGIGGGGIAVPLAQMLCRLPLRQCIAVSANVMCFTAGIGAAIKVATLGDVSDGALTWTDPVLLAIPLAPTAVIGGFIGAGLTHRIPVRATRIVFAIAMLAAAAKMLQPLLDKL